MLPDLKRTLRDVTKRLLPRSISQGAVRPTVRIIFSLIYGRRGYKIDIGGQGEFRMSPDLAFRGWERFGDRHNWAFAKCIDSCKGKSVFLDIGAHVGLYSLPASRALAAGGRGLRIRAFSRQLRLPDQERGVQRVHKHRDLQFSRRRLGVARSAVLRAHRSRQRNKRPHHEDQRL